MGDDLTEAGEFITSAMAQMDILLSELRLDSELALPLINSLGDGAKAVNARGIFRAAQRVTDSYDNGHSQPKIDGRLMSLYKLVVQYHSGWQEIAPLAESPAQEEPITAIDSSAEVNYEAAKATLAELMPLAGQERAALDALMGLDLSGLTSSRPAAQPPALKTAFETIMPDLINEALRFARGQGKSVSLSYAAEGLQLSAVDLAAAYIELEEIVTGFISRKIATPTQRAQQGLPRSGHIDISVMNESAKTKLSVSCEGEQKDIALSKTPSPRPQSAPALDPLMELGT